MAGNVSLCLVGNVSPKHCVGDSRLDLVFGRKLEKPIQPLRSFGKRSSTT
ncbi:MAG: hypothetical protein LBI18_07095 [Planctomycetaceae bacterium]|nr:hypothetical protein [Planctomycetaceae bacterium]